MIYFNGYFGGLLFGLGIFTANIITIALFHRPLLGH